MNCINYDFELYKLSNQFIKDYPSNLYPEILSKTNRPHYCLLIDTHCDYFICLPFRSNIEHKNAFKFKNTNRSQQSNSGLDYTKMVIINNHDYLDNSNIVIDQDEYKQAMQNIKKIIDDATEYLQTYIEHINNKTILHKRKFDRLYKYSTLPYFHDVLNLPVNSFS